MKSRSWILMALVMLLSLILAACSSGGGEKVTVATDATWPPFEIVDETTKEIIGFDIDLMKAIAEKGGFEVEFVNVGFDPLLAGMASCQYDAAISAITITEERKADFAFSGPYFSAGQVVAVRADNSDIAGKDSLSGKTVGAQIGTTGAIVIEEIAGATLKTYDDIGLAYQDLINGQVDAVVADDGLARGYVSKNSAELKIVGDPFTDESYGIAVCKTNADLLAKINTGLEAVRAEGLLETLTQKWLVGEG
ncbi:MAG TPA: basic amino acid ABC transporter substrate-binding protein [Anaerolineales bacterium]|nr:basic amino acid ABC transporter substrate-binding protein [Anaerolineales bacterium]